MEIFLKGNNVLGDCVEGLASSPRLRGNNKNLLVRHSALPFLLQARMKYSRVIDCIRRQESDVFGE